MVFTVIHGHHHHLHQLLIAVLATTRCCKLQSLCCVEVGSSARRGTRHPSAILAESLMIWGGIICIYMYIYGYRRNGQNYIGRGGGRVVKCDKDRNINIKKTTTMTQSKGKKKQDDGGGDGDDHVALPHVSCLTPLPSPSSPFQSPRDGRPADHAASSSSTLHSQRPVLWVVVLGHKRLVDALDGKVAAEYAVFPSESVSLETKDERASQKKRRERERKREKGKGRERQKQTERD